MTPLQRVQRALEASGWLNCDPEDWEAVCRDLEVEQIKRQVAESRFERAVKVLSGIHELLAPAPVALPDGRSAYFNDPDAARCLSMLSERIRAIPGEIDKARSQK